MPLLWQTECLRYLSNRDYENANRLLNDTSIDINAVDENGMTILMHLVKTPYSSFTVQFIQGHSMASRTAPRRRLNLNAMNKNGEDAYSLAVAFDNIYVSNVLDVEKHRQDRLKNNNIFVGYHATGIDAFKHIVKDKRAKKYPMIGGNGGYFGGGIYFATTQKDSTRKALSQGMGFECNLNMGEVLKISNSDELNEFLQTYSIQYNRYHTPTDVMAHRLLTLGDKPYDSVWGHYDNSISVLKNRILRTGDEYVVYFADQVVINKTFIQRDEGWIDFPIGSLTIGGRKQYEQCTVKELQARCSTRKIAYRGKRKAELIAELRKK